MRHPQVGYHIICMFKYLSATNTSFESCRASVQFLVKTLTAVVRWVILGCGIIEEIIRAVIIIILITVLIVP